jgi:protein-tyrosine phosphatase
MRSPLFTMTTAGPGKLSTMARPRGGDRLAGEMSSLRQAGTDVLVCMLTASERRELELAEEATLAQAAGIRFIGFPTPDRGAHDLASFRALVLDLAAELARGHHVVVHCRMGIGRASMVAAGVLVAQGRTAPEAWAVVSDARGLPVPDSPQQRRWLDAAMA